MALNFVRQYNFRHSPTPTHSHRHLHAQVHRIIHNIHALKTIYNTNLNNLMDKGTRGENMASLLLWRKKCFEVEFEVQGEFLLERKRKVSPCTGVDDGNSTGTTSGKSGT